uniref:Ubiquitin carboxyl-terminal hydrolase MINDY n=1 Tax=Bubo bubo TaxID=30461 RepID=A0A8C0EN92_BUBBB
MATLGTGLLFGDVSRRFSCEWANAHFRFRQPCSDLAYALEAEKVNVKAQRRASSPQGLSRSRELRRVSGQEQGEALAAALADTLWAAAAGGRGGGGGGRRAVVCLLAAAAHVVPRGDYEADSFTERVSMSTPAANRIFFKDTFGEGSHGVILFLYSLLFSRTLERYISFFKRFPLAVLSLLLTGRAGPHDLDGSRETPQLPVWLCGLAGRHGVLFSTDSQLLSDWKRERVFHLHFYNGQARAAHLTIDTHSHPWEEDPSEGPSSPGKRRPPVEMAIRSKWAGASISWNGTGPFF